MCNSPSFIVYFYFFVLTRTKVNLVDSPKALNESNSNNGGDDNSSGNFLTIVSNPLTIDASDAEKPKKFRRKL